MPDSPKTYVNGLPLVEGNLGQELRVDMKNEILSKGGPMPKTVLYKDIDEAVKKWVEVVLDVSFDGKKLPTYMLLSNQRLSEYAQTWRFNDNERNLLMNFKTITRENNPKHGTNQGNYWNVPDTQYGRYYTLKRKEIIDRNGNSSFIDYQMKQPKAIDLLYKVSIITNKLELINTFNEIVNNRFKARQDYIMPNGYAFPMLLDNISDMSDYTVDDRKYYNQTYDVKVMSYIINENDFKIREIPSKIAISFNGNQYSKPIVEVEESSQTATTIDAQGNTITYYPENLIISFPANSINLSHFTMDSPFKTLSYTKDNIRSLIFKVNGDTIGLESLLIPENGEVTAKIIKINDNVTSKLVLSGYNPQKTI